MSREKFNIEDLDVLELERLRELAKTRGATKKTQEVDTIPRVPRSPRLPSSFSQQRLWFLSQQEENGEKYHVPAALRLTGALDKDALRRAIRAIVARHEALRSTFVWDEGQLHVELLSPESLPGLVETDLCDVEDGDDRLEGILLEERFAPFDLSRDAPIRVRLVQRAKDDHVLLITQHHIASDGWSMGIFANELQTLYTAFRAGLPNPLAALPIQYPDYAAWQRQWLTDERIDDQAAYWRHTLDGVPHLLELPTSRRRPEVQSFVGARMPVQIDASLSDRVRRLGQAHGCTPFIVVLAAWAAVLSRVSGQDDVVVGTPSANRGRRETEGLIGFFVNTLALRIGLDEAASVSDLLAHVRTAVLSAQKHQDLPFEQVVEIARPPRSMSHAPLFQVMLLWQSTEGRLPELPGVDISLLEANHVPVKYDMELELSESAGEIVGGLTYATALFDAATAERYVDYLQAMLRAMAADATQPVVGIDMLSSPERNMLLETWNATSAPYAKDACVHALFERQVVRTPDAVAITCDGESLTYGQLNAQANGLAHHLVGQGVGPDVPVAICTQRGLPMVVGLLGILKAGGAYVPLDPAYPSHRLAQVFDEAQAPLALVDRAGRAALGESLLEARRVVDLEAMEGLSARTDNPVVSGLAPDRLMYVIYTSGSTGVPKGVMVEHGSVVNFLGAMADTVGIVEADRLLAVTSLSFDIAALEIFLPLMAGARTVLARRDDVVDAGVLQSMLASARITMMQATPATWNTLIATGWPGDPALSILCGGEAMPALLAEGLAVRGKQVWNLYGPTETTIWSSCARIDRHAVFAGRQPSIGRPIANTRIYLLDAHGQPVPRGTTGELYIGGDGVARGYLNRPSLTAERFVDDPFAGTAGARMYRTGDLARYLPDGEIECLGRNDHQVKIRGFRIELGEIETRLAEHPTVREAVVLAREDVPGEKRLVAYVIGAEGAIPEASSLRAHVAAGLPDYMLPAAFVAVDAWPLTPNGKLDRKALPAPEGEDYLRHAYAAPQGETETVLAGLWQELLGVDRVSRHDHFFELGGHSLLAVLLIERLRGQGLHVDVRALFATPVLSDLAVGLDQAEDEALPPSAIQPDSLAITPAMLPLIDLVPADIDRIVERTPGGIANIQDIYALTSLQDGILFHHMLAEEGDPYLLSTLMAFPSRALLDRFLATVQTVVDRHDILRTAFHWEGLSVPAQVVWRHAPLAVFEIALDPTDGPVERQLAERFDSHRHRMDLGRAPLLHFAIAHDPSNDRWVVLQRLHHLVGDHSTLEVLHEEVRQLFAGRTDLAPPQPFRRLVARIRRGLSAQEHERFFRDMLGDVTEPTLPFGVADLHAAGPVGMVSLPLSKDLNGRLRAQARRLGVGVASLCHLAWGQVLARSSGQEQVVFGTVLFGRMQAGEASQGVGLFINTLPLRLDLGEVGTEEAVRQTHARLTELLVHEHASLALAQRCSGVDASTPLFSSLFNYRHQVAVNADEVAIDDPMEGMQLLETNGHDSYPLTLSIEDSGDALAVTTLARDPLSPARICDYMRQALESLADALEHEPHRAMRELEVLPDFERRLLLETWNTISAPYASDICVHAMFERQAVDAPDAIAVVCGGDSLTYRELNAQANRLAHHLIERGVGPDERVAICTERGLPMVVGLLGVLKAGGAYVPLDPAYPVDRLVYLLEDSRPRACLVDATGALRLQGRNVSTPVVRLDRPDALRDIVDDPSTAVTPDHLAYVIYTSGSTGTPKGVMVSHRQLESYLAYARASYLPGMAGSVVSSGLGFDATITTLLPSLSAGKTVSLLPDDDTTMAVLAQRLFAPGEGWLFKITPAHLQGLFHLDRPECGDAAHCIVIGGEQLPASTLRTWKGSLLPRATFVNEYGPTETVVGCSVWILKDSEQLAQLDDANATPIGRAMGHAQLYVLDAHGRPVPMRSEGELYIGGAGLARGYLDRPSLTAERFVEHPYRPGERLYRTGDRVRHIDDEGNLEFLGRLDDQVKIRGFRIEPGEIEARLGTHAQVREAVVLAREDVPGEKRLVAYVIGVNGATPDVASLREHVAAGLPDYMLPAAFVAVDAWPLTPNGKLDRKALPAPEDDAYLHREYAAPQGETEAVLAGLWQELLGVERVSRRDHFFELGGHSLLAVLLIERLRREGRRMDIRALFATPVLSDLAVGLDQAEDEALPPSAIQPDSLAITPAMLPLIDLVPADIDRIVERTPGGVANIQDIYALTSLQDGILFHHMLAEEGDPYLLSTLMAFPSRALLDRFLATVQTVVDRHDILRTAFHWEGLSVPAQVVWRHAPLAVFEIALDPAEGPVERQLAERFDSHRHRMDLGRAPLLHFAIAHDPSNDRWVVLQRLHHLVGDHSTLDVLHEEVRQLFAGRTDLAPPQPFRRLVARIRRGLSAQEHERFFRDMLGDVTEPTLPFGLADLHAAAPVGMVSLPLSANLNGRLRAQARRLGVGVASLCHLAWGQVLARSSGQEQVVFGTVLFGRMQAGEASQGVGLFINTLPLRLDLGEVGAEEAVRQTHARLTELLVHEHASLALAQRCSGVDASTPLFSSLFNYRHQVAVNADEVAVDDDPMDGVLFLGDEVRNNYPLTLSVEDFGDALAVTTLARDPLSPTRICDYMRQALESLAEALEREPRRTVRELEVLPDPERRLLLETWNATPATFAQDTCVHAMFERQVAAAPDAIAVVCGDDSLTYGELNAQANRLAHHLIERGVVPDGLVAICAERGLPMVVGMLGVLKAGGAYVPLDPAYASERLAVTLADAAPSVVLADATGRAVLGETVLSDREVVALESLAMLPMRTDNPVVDGLTPDHLMYVIYTSGSTGVPKGVMVEHRSVVNFHHAMSVSIYAGARPGTRVGWNASFSFDMSIKGFAQLLSGHCLVIVPQEARVSGKAFMAFLQRQDVDAFDTTPSQLKAMIGDGLLELERSGTWTVLIGGEPIDPLMWSQLQGCAGLSCFNMYGPTECTVDVTIGALRKDEDAPHIGRVIPNDRIYLLDGYGMPVPIGAAGEIHVGGKGLARGYLRQPDLTGARFVADPFDMERPGARMYKTGDMGAYLPDGRLRHLGRNDRQVKVRGFRVELGEIEARLADHALVRAAAVVARSDATDGTRIIGYYVFDPKDAPDPAAMASILRTHMADRLPDYMIPSAFVGMDALPLTPNGKLDQNALPDPDANAYASRAFVAPRGELEVRIADLWQALLGVEQVGRNDNFFDLGGHSLLAVQLMARTRQALGINVALRELFTGPTLAEFTANVMASATGHSDLMTPNVVSLRSSGYGSPLFLVHSGGGGIDYARQLLDHLDETLPVHAIEASGITPDRAPIDSMKVLVDRYLAQIRYVQPSGPYRIAGWSAGGVIAYQLASRLSAMGDSVGFVGLLDSYCPPLGGDPDVAATFDEKHELLQFLDRSEYVDDAARKQIRDAATDLDFNAIVDMVYAMDLPQQGVEPLPVFDADSIRSLMAVRHATKKSVAECELGTVPVPVHLFEAEDNGLDASTTWKGRADLTVIRVKGSHLTMIDDPNHIRRLGHAISSAMTAG